jgi:hypothetical protein
VNTRLRPDAKRRDLKVKDVPQKVFDNDIYICNTITTSKDQQLPPMSWSPQWVRPREVAIGVGSRECPTGGLWSVPKPLDRQFGVAAASVCELTWEGPEQSRNVP